MGQAASSARGDDGRARLRRRSRPLSQLDFSQSTPILPSPTSAPPASTNRPDTSAPSAAVDQQSLRNSARSRHRASYRPRPISGTFHHHQIAAHSTLAVDTLTGARRTHSQDAVVMEQEERPLMTVDDLGMSNAPITTISASPMPRPPSVLTRLGTRWNRSHLLSASSTSSPSEDAHGLFSRPPFLRHRTPHVELLENQDPHASDSPDSNVEFSLPRARDNPHRTSIFDLFGLHGPRSASDRSNRRLQAPISRPIPISSTSPLQESSPFDLGYTSVSEHDEQLSPSLPRVSRLTRVRRRLSGTMESLMGTSQDMEVIDETPSIAPPRPPRSQPMEGADGYLTANSDQTLVPGPRGLLDSSLPLHSRRHADRSNARRAESDRPISWSQRLAERASLARRDDRRMSGLLRGRSSRLIRRDDETPLSRILQLAAAAIAAQLSGSTDALADMEAIGEDHFDGGLNTFVEELSHATGTGTGSNRPNLTMTTLPPLNFWRVFRFVNSADRNRSHQAGTDGRMVTLVVVGVRSVPSSSIHAESGEEALESSLDTLMSLPMLPGSPTTRSNPSPSAWRESTSSRLRQGHRRGSSWASGLPIGRTSEHRRSRAGTSASGPSSPITPAIGLNDSPPGPHPPPSTPSDPAFLSGTTTPSRRPSSASAAQRSPVGGSATFSNPGGNPAPNDNLAPPPGSENGVRQRRRSDSEYARHRDLGSGAARRNGVVEPDNPDGQGRSWLIYVVGTNLSEDHPALDAPSLFTDNPTYEDMMLLSSILGTVKPPVATRDDLAASSGLFRITHRATDGSLQAVFPSVNKPPVTDVKTTELFHTPPSSPMALSAEQAATNAHIAAKNVAADADCHPALPASISISIACHERCLVCLCEYDLQDEVRQLPKCLHVFHQTCIDTWLLTGRNSCPLCRGQGVEERRQATQDATVTSADHASPPSLSSNLSTSTLAPLPGSVEESPAVIGEA